MNHNLEEKLTAYALGELDGADAIEIETLLEDDERARRYVEEIRVIGGIAEEAFASESLGEERHEAILAGTNIASLDSRRSFWSIPLQARLAMLAASVVFVAGLAYVSAGLLENQDTLAEARATASMELKEDELLRRAASTSVRSSSVVSEEELVELRERALDETNPDHAHIVQKLGTLQTQLELFGSSNEPNAATRTDGGLQNVQMGGEVRVRQNFYSDQDVDKTSGETVVVAAGVSTLDALGVGTPDGITLGLDGRGSVVQQGQTTELFALGDTPITAETLEYRNGLGSAGGSGGGNPNAVDYVRQQARSDNRDYFADFDSDGLETEMLSEQLEALGYLGDGDQLQLGTSTFDINGLPAIQLGKQFQTALVDSYIVPPQQQQPGHNTEAYDRIVDNPFKRVIDEPLSTFSIDVDTGSYPNVRRFLRNNQLPPKDAVRIEELLNYFQYDYTPPANDDPFAAHVELVECPWNAEHQLMRIGLKGREVEVHTRPAANLVFLLDVSGSMSNANKLPLVRNAMKMLTKQLRPDDRVAIVTYAGASGLVLPSTLGSEQAAILSAIGRLNSGGSTNGAAGIELAYQVAQENFFDGGVNRVILATDGDFNVGTTDRGSLDRLIEQKAKSGVFLTVLGVGDGNLKDATMEQLADKGNGQYAYLDSEREARKVLVDQVGGTLVTIAKDVKIQIDFNPAQVGAYRLIGYENRVLAAQDFDDDTKDAGEIGAGHNVTALYEITPPGVIDYPTSSGTQSRYVAKVPAGPHVTTTLADGTVVNELLTVKLRHKQPDGDTSELLEIPITAEVHPIAEASRDTRFAASVAAFGMALRESPYRGTTDWDLIANLAEDGLGDDPHGYRAEFMELIQIARGLKPGIALQQRVATTSSPALELLKILPYTGGSYVAQIRTQTARPKLYGIGDQFESFRIISIDPSAQEVVVYSEEHRKNFTLTPAN